MYRDKLEDKFILVGIVKGGGECGTIDQPSVNTRIAPYVPWIESIIQDNDILQS